MSRTKGTYTLTSNIEPKVGAPLDARTVVKLLTDLTANNTFEYPYKGMTVFVEENTFFPGKGFCDLIPGSDHATRETTASDASSGL